MKIKYIKDKFQIDTQKLDFIHLNSLIPSNFSKKSPSADLLSKNSQETKAEKNTINFDGFQQWFSYIMGVCLLSVFRHTQTVERKDR